MGAWGKGFLENDTALDLVAHWDQFMMPYIASASWNGEEVWDFFKRIYFRHGINHQDSSTNTEILAIGALYQKHKLLLPSELKTTLGQAANAELRKDALNEWDDPKERRRVLLALLTEIGETRNEISAQKPDNSAIERETKGLLSFTEHFDRWAKVVSPPHNDDDFERLYPAFFDSIEKVLMSGIRPGMVRTNAQEKLIQLRFMIMAFYVAWKVGKAPSDILELVRQAEATGGSFFLALDVGGSDA
jgi:hypothetical protein